jgi:hypothetical protein
MFEKDKLEQFKHVLKGGTLVDLCVDLDMVAENHSKLIENRISDLIIKAS